MADPAPKERGRRSTNRRKARATSVPDTGSLVDKPLTRELIEQLGTGGPWESDEEFEEFLRFTYENRRANI